MPPDAAPNPQADADRLEAATDQAIAACGGNARNAVKALIVANEYLESEVCELMQAVSHALGSKLIADDSKFVSEFGSWPELHISWRCRSMLLMAASLLANLLNVPALQQR
jgi:hypothetical protein